MLNYDKAKLRAEIGRDEGYRNVPYFDSEGILTIGWGHALGHVGVPSEVQQAMLVSGVMDKPWPTEVPDSLHPKPA